MPLQNGLHGVPQLVLESLDVDLLPYGESIELNLLIGSPLGVEALQTVLLEHVPQILLLLLSAVVPKAMVNLWLLKSVHHPRWFIVITFVFVRL